MSETQTDPQALHEAIRDEVNRVLVGQDALIERLTISLLTRGHILLEGVPGIAKTTLANLFAEATGLSHTRIQMTPDILPADITGTNVYRESTGEFEVQKGPVFANVVVADEINRATPKAQSALLEAMQERNVTIGGETYELHDPFMVIATQNPLEMEGVFSLPEAQRDRFQFKLLVGYPTNDDEQRILRRFDDQPELDAGDVEQVVSLDAILSARDAVTDVYVADEVLDYIIRLIEASRDDPNTEIGGSPRASLMLMHAAKGRAAIRGRVYVIPDDVNALIEPVLRHRLVLNTDAELGDVSRGDVIQSLLNTVDPPSSTVAEDLPKEVRQRLED